MKGLSPKLMIGSALVITAFIMVSLAQEMNRRLQVQREIVQLDQEVRKLEKNLIEMENLNQYFRTDAFQERMAREKLNYRAEGEKVVLIPEEYSPIESESNAVPPEEDLSISRRWWKAFFGDPLQNKK